MKVEREARSALVGRDRERALLWEALERAIAERESQLVTIVGVPGIGKSRLVYELFRMIEHGGRLICWRHGRSLPYGEGVSFWALADMIKAHAGILESDDDTTAAERLRRAIEGLVAEPEERAWLQGHLRPLVGLEASSSPSSDRRAESFAAWRRFFEAMAEQRPLVLIFEDLHWAGDDLLDFVDHLVDWVSGVPLLVVATARLELLARRPAWSGGKTNALTVRLTPLGEEGSSRLVSGLLGDRQLPDAVRQRLIERAEGNPLYAEEFVRLVEEGREPAELPATVQGIIAARLDALPFDEKPLVQGAAVVGKILWVSALAQVAEIERPLVEDRLHGLERKDFVRRERRTSVAGETEFAFRHLLIRDVAYGQIPRAARVDKHLAVAGWIESLGRTEDHAEMLAHHYLLALELAPAAGRPTEPIADRARLALRRAGERATGLNAFAAAAGYYRRALSLWPPDDADRGRLLLELGTAEYLADGGGEAHLREAAEVLRGGGDRESASEAEVLLSDRAWIGGTRDRAYEHLERARALVADAPPSAAKARVLSEVARYHMVAGRNDEGIAVGREALAMAQQFGVDEIEAHAWVNIGTARAAKGEREGLDDIRRGLQIALRINSLESGRAYNNLAVSYARWGDFRAGLEVLREGLAVAERFGRAGGTFWFLAHQSIGERYVTGDWAEARRLADGVIEGGGPRSLAIAALVLRADMNLASGRQAEADADSETALAYARDAKEPQWMQMALAMRALVEIRLGRRSEAARYVEELIALDPVHDVVPGWTPPLVTLAWVADELGGADELLGQLRAVTPRTVWHDLLAAIIEGDLLGALEIASPVGSLPLQAYLQLRAGRQLLADGRKSDAGRTLEAARSFWRSVGASYYAAEAEAMLRSAQ